MWFMISMIYMNYGNVAPEILVYKTVYQDKYSCQRLYQDKPQVLINEMAKLKPRAVSISFTCVDALQLNNLKLNNKIKKL